MRRPRGADRAAGAGDVLHDHALTELFSQARGENASRHVCATTGRERNEQLDRMRRILLCPRGQNSEREQEASKEAAHGQWSL